MFDDDLEPRAKKPKPKDLTLLGVTELEDYIAARQKQKSGAEALFKR